MSTKNETTSNTSTFEIGDRVTFVSKSSLSQESDAWNRRKGRAFTVVSAYDNGGEVGVEYQCIEVTPMRNRHNSTKNPDYFFATAKNLSLVAKAVYVDAAILNDPTVVTL